MLNNTDWNEIIANEDRIIANSDRKYRYHCQSFEAIHESFLFQQSIKNFYSNEIECDISSDDFIQSVKNEKLKKALYNLTSKQQRVVELYFWKGFTQQEISEIMGCRQSTISIFLKRAFAIFKKIMLE